MPTARQEAATERRVARERFMRARVVERQYMVQLQAVGRHVGDIVKGFAPGGVVEDINALKRALASYSSRLNPWAESVTRRMQLEVNRRDLTAWTRLSQSIGAGLERELASTPVGHIYQGLLVEQVELITKIPLDAAERVYKLSTELLISGRRADEIAKDIMLSGHVAASDARRVARTAVTSTATTLTEARALYIGSESYVWHTLHDSSVRALHRDLDGRIFRWDNPPITSSNGFRSHPGQAAYCRCYPEPLLPDRVR